MAGFSRIKGSDRGFERLTISSLALGANDVVAYDRANAKVIKATSSTTIEDVAGVTTESTTTADTSVLVQKIVEGDEYVVNSTNNSNVAHNYQRMVLTDENEVNNTGTDSTADAAIVMQVGVKGAAADKLIIVKFVTRQDRA